MPGKCVICKCDGTMINKKISLFRFPINVPTILQKWIKAVNKKNWVPTSSSRVCQLHFISTDFTNTSGRVLRLKPDTIPTQNLKDSCENKINLDVCYISSTFDFNKTVYTSNTSTSTANTDNTQSRIATMIDSETQRVTTQADNTILKVQAEKCKNAQPLERTNMKYHNLKEENKKLKIMIETLTQDYEQKLHNQADMFKSLMKKERNVMKEKLAAKKHKLETLQKRNKRMQNKVAIVMQELKE